MNKSLIDFVYELLQETGEQPVSFDEIREKIKQNYTFASEEEELEKIAQLYTDLNIDGLFVNLGANRWALRVWYPFDKSDEDLVIEARQRGELDEFEEEFEEADEGIVDIEDDLDVFAKVEDYDSSEFDDEDEEEKVEGLDDFKDDDLDDDLDLEDEDDL
ncbi:MULTISPECIES: DNA-directed RNA polymerase subunit delta [Exiguobacterium]|jgi:DNA-directed RNA polymerase subunit delta|uniref:RNAP delta factor n=1 Tax=Exiguobacterium sp. (strain ATCC BAA-1283 / AT1b) TaxID=360911 RepID=C4KYX2_EXISA|nr:MULTISPECIES: DNA-directed RNA polymerase subunit delta [Exiguobacterium]MCC9621800.1 DNA-directed RNA polymerase subunit delta [Thalassospira sp. MA62]ACQ70285.1 DNA-directed RNA polymerase delta subunit [Exiguobacterium sp. AT1b]MCA0981365.1 DNA-directed RNA polymerase subunit delta [Exiguobacterium aestuarii]MDA5560951.1 DNA-directed RNA polymerase subunit delta [Exiguobacterium sp. MMG028]MDX5980549.1 DNA-directed RNA polymerase subunit delta [Exiguobacterium profundum]